MVHRLSVPLLVAALVGTACSAPKPPEREAAPFPDPRRERLRDELRNRLGDRYDAPLPVVTIEGLQRGAKLYDVLCRSCHGPTGTGTGRAARALPVQPPDLTDPRTASFFSEQAKLAIIAEGIQGTPMIGWNDMLDQNEQVDVLQFMGTLVRERKTP